MDDYRQLLCYSDERLAKVDPLVMNLLVARSIPCLAELIFANTKRWRTNGRRP